MKKNISIISLLFTLITLVSFYSCENENEEIDIVPEFNVGNSTYDVGYEAGSTVIDVTSNVIYYVHIDDAAKGWLKYSFSDSCKTLSLVYSENTDTTLSRTGYATISKFGVSEVITVNQAKATPPRIKPVINIGFQSADNSLTISAQECLKIPVGSILEIESSSNTGSFQLSGFDDVSGNVSEGTFSFEWTHEMDSIGRINGITGILGNGFNPSKIYSSYVSTNYTWEDKGSVSFGGFTYYFIAIPANEAATIPVGSTMYVGTAKDVGTFIAGQTRYNPVNGKLHFAWNSGYIGKNGAAEFIWTDGLQIAAIYAISFNIDLFPEIKDNGGNISLKLNLKEASYIPIGATVVIKCEDDSGTININGFPELTGSPVNGEFSFNWTSAIRDVGELNATISGGSKPLVMYFRN
jgi:hypothetical protein